MAGLAQRWLSIGAMCLLVAAAGLTLLALSSSDETTPLVSAPSATSTSMPALPATPALPIVPRNILYQSAQDGRLYAYAVPGSDPEDLIFIETLAKPGGTLGHVIVWRAADGVKTQLFEASLQDRQPHIGFAAVDSAVIYGVQQTANEGRELAIVYDATAYGSGSPTAGVVLLRLEDDGWRILWDSWVDTAEWRGGHGRVEFWDMDVAALEVRGDIWGGPDEVSHVLFEANAGPHRQFIDRWERDGDRYVLVRAETVPSAYATLVEFLYALGTGDYTAAGKFVTDPALIGRARSLGLDDALGKNWLIDCADFAMCLQTGPIGFDPLRTRGEPAAEVFFEEIDGRWLIDDIREDQQP